MALTLFSFKVGDNLEPVYPLTLCVLAFGFTEYRDWPSLVTGLSGRLKYQNWDQYVLLAWTQDEFSMKKKVKVWTPHDPQISRYLVEVSDFGPSI